MKSNRALIALGWAAVGGVISALATVVVTNSKCAMWFGDPLPGDATEVRWRGFIEG